jgi:hypothetical protein
MRACRHFARTGFTRPSGSPSLSSQPFGDNPSREKAGRAAPFRQALDAKRGPRGCPPPSSAMLRADLVIPSPRPGAGRKSPLIGAGLAGLRTQPH